MVVGRVWRRGEKERKEEAFAGAEEEGKLREDKHDLNGSERVR